MGFTLLGSFKAKKRGVRNNIISYSFLFLIRFETSSPYKQNAYSHTYRLSAVVQLISE